jgi:hypothetical protein
MNGAMNTTAVPYLPFIVLPCARGAMTVVPSPCFVPFIVLPGKSARRNFKCIIKMQIAAAH